MDLWWKEYEHYSYLHVGCCDKPIASIYRSNKGKHWSTECWIPISIHRKWAPLYLMKELVETASRNFFDLANTSRPAVEQPDA